MSGQGGHYGGRSMLNVQQNFNRIASPHQGLAALDEMAGHNQGFNLNQDFNLNKGFNFQRPFIDLGEVA